MTGREPMNPQVGQYRLGGTLQGWTRLDALSARQLTALRLAYAGLTPRVYGRYGHKQWAAAWPGTRTVVKDPFAMLSVATVASVTSALPVLVYRHPAAVLLSYRRMGWFPDVAQVVAALPGSPQQAPDLPCEDARSLAWFWSTLNTAALRDLDDMEDAIVVSHEELASGGIPALHVLFKTLGLELPTASAATTAHERFEPTIGDRAGQNRDLHRLDRSSEEVAKAWRSGVTDDDLGLLEALAGPTLDALEAARLKLT